MAGPSSGSNGSKEFARLMDFFDRLAVHRARNTGTQVEATQDEIEVYIPNDVAPLIRGLKSQIANRKEVPSASTSPQAMSFPVSKGFPFTFKMRLHELYELEDWAKKINQEVEKSRSEFRSLSEQEAAIGLVDEGENLVTIRPGRLSAVSRPGRRSAGWERSEFTPPSPSAMRRSGRSMLSPGLRTSFRPSTTTMSPKSTIGFPRAQRDTTEPGRADDVRVVKKRCVGRTKSLVSGKAPFAVEMSKEEELEEPARGNTWVYQGVVSSTQVELDTRNALRDVQPVVLLKGLKEDKQEVGGGGGEEENGVSWAVGDKRSEFGMLSRDAGGRKAIGNRRATISGPFGSGRVPLMTPRV